MQLNKIHSVRTFAPVAKELGEDEDWLSDLAIEMEPEDGLIWVYGPSDDDAVMAFSHFYRGSMSLTHRTSVKPVRRLSISKA